MEAIISDGYLQVRPVFDSAEMNSHVSLFIPLMARPGKGADRSAAGDDQQKERLRLKLAKLKNEARRLLRQEGCHEHAQYYLNSLTTSFNQLELTPQAKGIAIFVGPKNSFHTVLTTSPPELVVVADSFHFKPLMYHMSLRLRCHGILVTPNKIDLYRLAGTRMELVDSWSNPNAASHPGVEASSEAEVDIDTIDFVRATALKIAEEKLYDDSYVAILGPRPLRKQMRTAMNREVDIKVFFEGLIGHDLDKTFEPLYSSYIKSKSIEGEDSIRFGLERAEPNRVALGLDAVAEAAAKGQIAKLAIDPNTQVWGLFDRLSGTVKTYSKQRSCYDDCVLDDIAEEVIRRDGQVVFFDSTRMKLKSPVVAWLRW